MSWQECSLEELIELHDYRRIPLSGVEREKRQGKFRYYGAQGVIDHIDAYIFDGEYILVAEDGENLRSRKQPIAQIATGQFWVNNHAHILQAKDGVSNNAFICALLNWIDISPFVTGAAQPKLSQGSLKSIKVKAPDASTQLQIAVVLSAYDDLIATNHRRIALLEDAARRLYREWFVHLRFPGHESVPVKDGVPEGWRKTPIAEQTTFLNRGIAPKYDETAKGWVINQKCIRDGRISMVPARRQSKEVKPDRLVRMGDVLINSTGAGTLGRVAQVRTSIEACTVDTHVTIARPIDEDSSTYFGQALLNLEPIFSEMGKGATNQLELSRSDIGSVEIWQPPQHLHVEFHRLVGPMLEQAEQLSVANLALEKARDLLLPKLMSGQLDVSGIALPDEVVA